MMSIFDKGECPFLMSYVSETFLGRSILIVLAKNDGHETRNKLCMKSFEHLHETNRSTTSTSNFSTYMKT